MPLDLTATISVRESQIYFTVKRVPNLVSQIQKQPTPRNPKDSSSSGYPFPATTCLLPTRYVSTTHASSRKQTSTFMRTCHLTPANLDSIPPLIYISPVANNFCKNKNKKKGGNLSKKLAMQAHHHQEHPHDEIGEQGHEKKPVMKKVKDKVKKPVIKMKEAISKKMHHGHDDEHDDEHREREHDVEDVSEEEEGHGEDEEEEPGPEVHGAPMYESPATSHLIGGQNENLGPGKVGLREAMPATAIEDPAAPKNTGDESRLVYPSADKNTEKVSLGDIIGTVDEDAAAPKGKTEIPVSGGEKSQAMVSSPTAGRDKVGESPLLSSFKSMAITENPKDPQSSPPAGTHDQFSPEKKDSPKEEEKQTEHNQQNPPTYTEKLSSVATAAKDAAVTVAATSTEYTKKIASTVLDKASGASSAMMGKGSTNETEPKPDKGVSVKEYIVGRMRPGEEDRVLSEVISGAIQSKKQEATLVPETETEAKRSAEESGGGGMGMVDKIKGAVSSWIGAGSMARGKQASTTSESMDLKGKE